MAQMMLTDGGAGSKKSSGLTGSAFQNLFAQPKQKAFHPPMKVAATTPPPPVASAPVYDTYSGGGGGGGGSVAAAAAPADPAPPRPDLQDYINNNFLYKNANDEGTRSLQDYDNATETQRAQVSADQDLKRQQLQQQLEDQALQVSESLAGRGLLRSGFPVSEQDKINQFGNQQNANIDSLLTNFQSGRSTGRSAQEAANRQAIADAISKITDQYNSQYGV